ncbi:Cell division protein FtsH [uncultured Candidatus Thioglobus sp.]|nr:Cell division protein FtsH [uncultured Candidatus Thioglobus sp.]
MAQADLLVNLVKNASNGDQLGVHKITQNLIQEEKNKGHRILADRLIQALKPTVKKSINKITDNNSNADLYFETTPERGLNSLVLPNEIRTQIQELVQEQHRSELLHSYNLKARNTLLLAGPPGNGKTTLAEALAHELMYPLLVVRYENLVGSYLGETSGRLKSVLDYAKTMRCVLFFDEFETLAKERGDTHETGEIKRVVSSLLLQLDSLPDYVVVVTASNHPELLDKAVWRRFQIRIELPLPTKIQLTDFITQISKRCKVEFGLTAEIIAKHLNGLNFAEAEEFCLGIVRKAILDKKQNNAQTITNLKLTQYKNSLKPVNSKD